MTEKFVVYAIIRLDDMHSDDATLLDSVSVTSILPTQEDAETEIRRLNELNHDVGSRYHWIKTRYYPNGRKPND